MREHQVGSYVVLAMAVGGLAIGANAANAAELITSFDAPTLTLLSFVSNALAGISLAAAMVCAVLLAARLARTTRRQAPLASVNPTARADHAATPPPPLFPPAD